MDSIGRSGNADLFFVANTIQFNVFEAINMAIPLFDRRSAHASAAAIIAQ